MASTAKVAILLLCVACISVELMQGQELPTLYEYYTEGGITAGLEPLPDGFFLNNRNITIMSGALHYFRVHPDYWRDRLRKLRALGANTVETYVPWNLHEPAPGKFDFGNGQDDMSPFLDIVSFIRIAKEEDLLVLVRPGPYICAEWEFGGMPSWLLRDREMQVRSSDPRFEDRVDIYYSALLPQLVDLQFTNGGPIIAFQIENEYGNVKDGDHPLDQQYLIDLHQMMKRLGLKEMFFTSDTPTNGPGGFVPTVLKTANFNQNPEVQLAALKLQQPDKPLMVMEYWTGWFDHWMDSNHQTVSVERYADILERILKFPSSVNMYMYHGGTNWGFLNGANIDNNFPLYSSTITSYDYDAPLSQAGDYTDKYNATKDLYAQYNPVKTKLPEAPAESEKTAYPTVAVSGQLTLNAIIDQVNSAERFQSPEVVSMEMLDMNDGAGQSYGYIVYRKTGLDMGPDSILKVTGKVHDIATVLVDGELKTTPLTSRDQLNDFGFWVQSDAELNLQVTNAGPKTLEIMVENFGRNNFGKLTDFDQRKGLWEGPVLLNGSPLTDWEIVPLQFKGDWVRSLSGWTSVSNTAGPALYQGIFSVSEPRDTFVDMGGWGKGVVFVNGFNLGRYFNMGPTRTLYLPAPLLKTGDNQIVVFEHNSAAASEIVFSATPMLGRKKS